MATHNQNVAAAPQHQQQQNRVLGGGVPAAGKQKAAMAGRPETKPRRGVLRDIGNIGNLRVAEGKKQLQEPVNAHRPVTRNFGAQLIKKAQEKAKNPARLARVKLAPPPPEHVIEISSDSDVSKSTEGSFSSVRKQSRKKAINTLTSVLSARSKVHIMDVLVIRQKVLLDAMLCLNFAESEHLTSYYISELECYANRSFDDEFISNIDE